MYKEKINVNQEKDLELLENVFNTFNEDLKETREHFPGFVKDLLHRVELLHEYRTFIKEGLSTIKSCETSPEYRELIYLLICRLSNRTTPIKETVQRYQSGNEIFDSFKEIAKTNLFLKDQLSTHKDFLDESDFLKRVLDSVNAELEEFSKKKD